METGPKNFQCEICGSLNNFKHLLRGDNQKILICKSCGTGKLLNIPPSFDEHYSHSYFNGAEDGGYENYDSTAAHATLWLKRYIRCLMSEGKILDVGCANGYFLNSLGDHFEKFGIEISEVAFREAGSKGIQMIGHNLFEDKIREEFRCNFDIITAMATFEHMVDFRRAFEICLDLLKPEGILLFETPILSDNFQSIEWFFTSFEHIWYPSLTGIEIFLKSFTDCHPFGQEIELKGFPPTYIGSITKNSRVNEKSLELFNLMVRPQLQEMTVDHILLNISFYIFHCFSPNPERILYLPKLIEEESNLLLVKQLINLWHKDASSVENIVWIQRQVDEWRDAYNKLFQYYEANISWWKQEAKKWQENHDQLVLSSNENIDWWKQQAGNWKEAYDLLLKSLD